MTAARYIIKNIGDAPTTGRCFLAVHPVQISPSWQHGGLSFIWKLGFAVTNDVLLMWFNDQPYYVARTLPDTCGAKPLERGDIAEDLARGLTPPDRG